MQEVILVIHLILALTIIGLVLIQRSSGGGLGIGDGSGGMGNFATARGTANVLTKATTILAFMFFATSLSLAYIGKGAVGSRGLLSAYDNTATPAPAADGTPSPADTITEPGVTPAPAAAAPAADAPAAAPATTPEPPVSTE